MGLFLLSQLQHSHLVKGEEDAMPGHVKTGGPKEADPDPSPFLFVSFEIKKEDSLKPYDAKKSVWVPDGEGGFDEAMIDTVDGDKVNVKVGWEPKTFKSAQVMQVNPPKMEKFGDVSNMTYLNEASVLWNLKSRYVTKLIYTYSGLFCVVINPYKRYPIYTNRVVQMYIGKRRNEVPPHLFAISDGAYQQMMNQAKDQSMLITGESGAGKTENTKKVITYFAILGATEVKKKAGDVPEEKKANLEDRIVNTNPILESYGNAKTIRNDNSSRFGKFIRIYFNSMGKLAGGFIDVYLLEKSRVTYQQPNERCYHIFFQLVEEGIVEGLQETCCLSTDPYDYFFVSQGKVKVDSIDDSEELEFTDTAFDTLGFTPEEKQNAFKLTACILHLGEMTFKQKGREESCEMDDPIPGQNVSTLCGIENWQLFYGSFIRPKIKVGTEWVYKGQNADNCLSSVAALARSMYNRLFMWLVDLCNRTLIDPTMKKVNFIGVLDIAGFEIFEFNTFEQICINFVNEKLQQFFNHHMFVLEQEEYMREGITWVSVDFGMDLAACIDLFEKPMGILPILEEETIYPKASDQTFEAKLKAQHLGKHNNFVKAQSKTDKDAHFAVVHYAGTVSYNVTGWLDKNRDPINDTVVDLLKKTKTLNLMNEIYSDHPGQTKEEEDLPPPGHRRGKKRVVVKSKTAAKMANFKTVCSYFKDQLNNLINMLMTTEPSFIRCIVPNNHKKPGVIDPFLVMHQLTCNGVLEGIRICRKGFPNRVIYLDFRTRYVILAPKESVAAMKKVKRPVTEEKKNIAATHAVMDKINLVGDKFQYGHTKIFFRAGILGLMEEIRDGCINNLVAMMQATIRAYYARRIYNRLWKHKMGLLVAQRTIRGYMIGKTWPWWSLWLALKPGLKSGHFEEFKQQLAEKIQFAQDHLDEVIAQREVSEKKHAQLTSEVDEIKVSLAGGTNAKEDLLSKIAKLEDIKGGLQKEINALNAKINNENEQIENLQEALKKTEASQGSLGREMRECERRLAQVQDEKADKDAQIKQMKEECLHQEELINKLNKEKKSITESKMKEDEQIQSFEDKCNHLNKLKIRLEKSLDEVEDSWEREKKQKGDIEKLKRQVEGNLKLTQETITDLERNKIEMGQVLQRKEKENGSLNGKVEDEQTLGGKLNTQIKERQARARADKGRGTLRRELDELNEKLEETGSNTAAQIALNTRREEELAKLKMELDEANITH